VGGQALGALALQRDDERRAASAMLGSLTSRLEIGGVELSQAWGLSRQARLDAETLAASFAT
jgi:hypothetical protein